MASPPAALNRKLALTFKFITVLLDSIGLGIILPFMTQLFGYFTVASAPIHFPGASFLLAAILSLLSLVLFAPHLQAARREG